MVINPRHTCSPWFSNSNWFSLLKARNFKVRQRGRITPFSYSRYRIPFKNLNEQKKPHQKILIFDEVMACHRSPFFGALKNDLKFSHGIWRHWRMEVENEWSFSLKHHLNNVLQFSSESMSVRYIVAFLCKKDRWVQKNGSRCLKLNRSSGMTS